MDVIEKHDLTEEDVTRLIGMAWEDDVPFEAIEAQYGVPEEDVIALMRSRLKRSSWELWRERVSGRPTKHAAKRGLTDSTSRRPPNGRPVTVPDALSEPVGRPPGSAESEADEAGPDGAGLAAGDA